MSPTFLPFAFPEEEQTVLLDARLAKLSAMREQLNISEEAFTLDMALEADALMHTSRMSHLYFDIPSKQTKLAAAMEELTIGQAAVAGALAGGLIAFIIVMIRRVIKWFSKDESDGRLAKAKVDKLVDTLEKTREARAQAGDSELNEALDEYKKASSRQKPATEDFHSSSALTRAIGQINGGEADVLNYGPFSKSIEVFCHYLLQEHLELSAENFLVKLGGWSEKYREKAEVLDKRFDMVDMKTAQATYQDWKGDANEYSIELVKYRQEAEKEYEAMLKPSLDKFAPANTMMKSINGLYHQLNSAPRPLDHLDLGRMEERVLKSLERTKVREVAHHSDDYIKTFKQMVKGLDEMEEDAEDAEQGKHSARATFNKLYALYIGYLRREVAVLAHCLTYVERYLHHCEKLAELIPKIYAHALDEAIRTAQDEDVGHLKDVKKELLAAAK